MSPITDSDAKAAAQADIELEGTHVSADAKCLNGAHAVDVAAEEQEGKAGMAGALSMGANSEESKAVDAEPSSADQGDAPAEPVIVQITYMDIFKEFSLMGWTAFGGPSAHIGLFQRVRPTAKGRYHPLASLLPAATTTTTLPARTPTSRRHFAACGLQRIVDRFHWLSTVVYGELFALGQCVPGPTSTQVSFAIGIVKKGIRGASRSAGAWLRAGRAGAGAGVRGELPVAHVGGTVVQ